MVGWPVLKVSGKAGTRVRMRTAEILNPDGTLYRDNLRNADATDIYVLRGEGIDTLVVAGLTTECCIDSSVRDAFEPPRVVFHRPNESQL